MILIASTDLKRLANLTPTERCLLSEALLLLPSVAIGLRFLGYRRILRKLEAGAGRFPTDIPADVPPLVFVELAVWAVRLAAARGPYRATCLRQSISLWWMLMRRGIGSEIKIGIQRTDTGIEAHAWVERDGRVLNDSQDIARRYPPFPNPGQIK